MTPTRSLAAMRAANPLVQCITNFVAMNFAANAMLAAGASPAMVHSEREAAEFASIASALTINIGTLSPNWVDGMQAAIGGAKRTSKPWVLDPVAHFATPYRGQIATELLALRPTVLRGNASEILSLSGAVSAGQGVDAGDPVAVAEAGAQALALAHGCVVAVTGEVDFVTDGTRAARIHGGSPLMPRVTATGCALTCVTGAYLAAVDDPFDATIGALALFAEAGAQSSATGPGSFAVAFLDALSAVETIDENRVEIR